MIIGVPRERQGFEHRVGLSPFAVRRLTNLGHSVSVERGAGEDAFFSDSDYQNAGAQIVYTGEEVLRRSDLLCRVSRLDTEEASMLQRGAVVTGFQHLAVARPDLIDALVEREATLLGYELVQDSHGELPILVPFSEMAGHMALQCGARFLTNREGGRGVLLGAVPCVAPPTVLILGAGRVGHAAASQALRAGVHTIVMDSDVSKLRQLHNETNGQVVTIVAGSSRLGMYTSIADLVIGAVLIPGGRAPFLVTEEMVRDMKEGSVILDISIDQGGCIETSRPTNLGEPTYVMHGVTHCCIPNLTANVARTASRALASAALPYLVEVAEGGLDNALRADRGLAQGVSLFRGRLVNSRVANALDREVEDLEQLLSKGSGS